jgi:hypothetical protein
MPFIPNFVPPSPQDVQNLLTMILDMIIAAPGILVANRIFETILRRLTPAQLKTWKGLLQSNTKLMNSLKNARLPYESRVTRTALSAEKNATRLVSLGARYAETLTRNGVQPADIQAAADAEITDAKVGEDVAARVATRGAALATEAEAGAELGPLDVALIAVGITGMALDIANVGGLQDWKQYTVQQFDAAKAKQDHEYAVNANNPQPTSSVPSPTPYSLPLYTGPLDEFSADDLPIYLQEIQLQLLAGEITVPDATYQQQIADIQNTIITNFYNNAPKTNYSSADLAAVINPYSLETLTDVQLNNLSNVAYTYSCTFFGGVMINGTYCSNTSSNCNLTQSQWNNFNTGSDNKNYTEWRTSDQIKTQFNKDIDKPGACLVLPYSMRMICDTTTKRGLDGTIGTNSYDVASGRCFNTRSFCDAYGVSFDTDNKTCFDSSTQQILSLIFGDTIVQGTKMVVTVAQKAITYWLDNQGPAGQLVAAFINQGLAQDGQVTACVCTLAVDSMHIIKDVFTGNIGNVKDQANNMGSTIKNLATSTGGFFMGVVNDFANAFS